MRFENLQSELEKFGKFVIQQSRSNLTKKKKNVSSRLYKELSYDLKTSKNSFSLSFEMPAYGLFQDKGVSGVKKKYNTPFSYKGNMPPTEDILKWVKAKNLRFRNKKTGKFSKGTQKSLAFLIARSIFRNGIKPSLFFTRPFELGFKKIPDELVEAFALDFDNFIDFTTKNNLE